MSKDNIQLEVSLGCHMFPADFLSCRSKDEGPFKGSGAGTSHPSRAPPARHPNTYLSDNSVHHPTSGWGGLSAHHRRPPPVIFLKEN